MKMKEVVGMAAVLVVAQLGIALAGEAKVTTIIEDGVVVQGNVQRSSGSVESNEAKALSAGAIRVTESSKATCPPPATTGGPTQNFQAPPPVNPPPPPANPPPCTKKRPGFFKRCFGWVGLSAHADASFSVGAPIAYGSHWEPNDSCYEARYYGVPDQVFTWGPGYSTYNSSSYTYVDNYRSGPYPPVRFIRDAPLGSPQPRYQPYCPPSRPPQGGGHGGRGGHR